MAILDLEVNRFKAALLKKALVCGMTKNQVFDYLESNRIKAEQKQREMWNNPTLLRRR